MKRWLVTTAIEATWPAADTPILFLGEWCRRYGRRAAWADRDADVLPYHWDDRAQFAQDYTRVQRVYEELLAELTDELNRQHRVAHSRRYWRIVVGPWLGFFVQMLFDRWVCIMAAAANPQVDGVTTLGGDATHLIPEDFDDFCTLYGSDAWNEHLYARLLRDETTIPCTELARPTVVPEVRRREPVVPLAARLRRLAIKGGSRMAALLQRQTDVALHRTYLPLRDELRLHLRLGQVPQYACTLLFPRCSVQPARRQWQLAKWAEDPFARVAGRFIAAQLPRRYLEGYAELVAQAERAPWPKCPRVIFTSNALYGDERFKAWAAERVDAGARLIVGQHGGHYGIGHLNYSEDHEVAVADRFLSWGWECPEHPNIFRIGQLKNRRPLGVHHEVQKAILVITSIAPRYSYFMFSSPVAGQNLRCIEEHVRFHQSLSPRVQQNVLFRLFGPDAGPNGWEQAERMRDALPTARFTPPGVPIDALLRQSRLVISTYNATTFLETFTQNIPTLMFWNPEHWEVRDSARPFFDALARAGVFHASPEDAARHLEAIWGDVEGWWRSAEVRAAVLAFCTEYSFLPDDLVERVAQALIW